MLGSNVTHPLYGRGQVREVRNAAREVVVRFDNGIRTVVPTNILIFLDRTAAPKAVEFRPLTAQRVEADLTPEQLQQHDARRTIEALRYGVVPSKRLRDMTVGLACQKESLNRAFEDVERIGGEVRVVVGEYGSGKSHFFEYAAQEALERNYLVATCSLDIQEVPPNRPQRIYNALIRSLRFPDTSDSGSLVPLLERIVTRPTLYSSIFEKLQGTIFGTVFHNYTTMRQWPGEESGDAPGLDFRREGVYQGCPQRTAHQKSKRVSGPLPVCHDQRGGSILLPAQWLGLAGGSSRLSGAGGVD